MHRALQKNLSINRKRDKSMLYLKKKRDNETAIKISIGDTVEFTVKRILPQLAIGFFKFNNISCDGTIHISQIADVFVNDINDYLHVGLKVQATVLQKSPQYASSWQLTLKKS